MIADIEYTSGVTPVKEEYITTSHSNPIGISKPTVTKTKIILTVSTLDGKYLLIENTYGDIELIDPAYYTISTLEEIVEHKQNQKDLQQYNELYFKLINKGLI